VRNYLKGNDPERWVHGARSFEHVVYQGLYEGVDLRLREADGMPEYDLLLAPGTDLAQVVVRCEGVSGLEVDEQGGLLMHSDQGVLRQSPPRTWCVLPSGETEPVECAFVVLGEARYGFRLAGHDPDLPVVVDPGLEWATYLGGSGDDWLFGVARMSNGDLVATGLTFSPVFPKGLITSGPLDAFVSVLKADGSDLVAWTLLGGSDQDAAVDVQVGPADEIYLSGYTNSADFWTSANAYQPTLPPIHGSDAFVVELDQGLVPVYSTFLGGTAFDLGSRILVSAPGILTIGGNTRSVDFPVTSGAAQGNHGGGNSFSDYFLARLDLNQPPASQLLYSTYVGGSDWEAPTNAVFEHKSLSLHEDASGVITLAGRTRSADIVKNTNGYDTTYDGEYDVYLARVDPAQSGPSGILYDTYIGGSSGVSDAPMALAVDSSGVVTLGGYTYSPGFPTTAGAFDTTFEGPVGHNDAFLLRLDPSQPPASQLIYSTLLSGNGFESVEDLALDSSGRIVAQGFTGRDILGISTFPTTCSGFQPDFAGSRDGFLVYLDPAGNGPSDLLYSTFLGGPGWDVLVFGLSILSEAPTLKVVGGGGSGELGFPATNGAFQTVPAGEDDCALYQAEINPHTYCVASANSFGPDGAIICGGGSVKLSDNAFTLSVTGATPGDFGLYFYGTMPASIPFADGVLCVSGSVSRLPPPLVADPSGSASRALDFTQPPLNGIPPGATRYFQYWYRDPKAGGKGSNFSNGLKVTFHP
jgi:hypothetical protein